MTTATGVAAVVVYAGVTLPPVTRVLDVRAPDTFVRGAYHIHTVRSDGSGTVDDVAVAAAAAGLQFVILTDHGDATRPPDAPAYRHGVLCIDAVEVSTAQGHMVALGLEAPAPYPLGGDARDAIEDVHRLGGWTIAAHPDSPKPDLRWRGLATVDGIEWLNADSEWRDDWSWRLLLAAAHSLVRSPEAIASVFSRPDATFRRWDTWLRQRPVTALAAVDAHARIGINEQAEPQMARTILARPSYADMFRTAVQVVRLEQPLTGDGPADAAALLQALRQGRTYSVIAALATPAVLAFEVTDGTTVWQMGDTVPASTTPLRMTARVSGAPDAVVALWHQGREVASGAGEVSIVPHGAAGAYRVEVRRPSTAVPWIVSNPIYLASELGAVHATARAPFQRPPESPPDGRRTTLVLPPDGPWTVEHHTASTGTVERRDGEVGLAYALAPGRPTGQYAALAFPLSGTDSFDEIVLTLRADHPMRLSVQVRLPFGRDGERWQRSVYVDSTPRTVRLRLEDLEPAGVVTSRRPIVARVQALLLVVDTLHTRPGTRGTVWASAVAMGAPRNAAMSAR